MADNLTDDTQQLNNIQEQDEQFEKEQVNKTITLEDVFDKLEVIIDHLKDIQSTIDILYEDYSYRQYHTYP